MAYYNDNRDISSTDCFINQTKLYEKMLIEHQSTSECLGNNCPECKKIQGWIDSSKPCLP